jgi:hypothetical protein
MRTAWMLRKIRVRKQALLIIPGRDENARPPELPPSHARVFRVAAGLDEWTPAERAWLKDNPKWLIYEQDFRDALRRHEERLAGRHADRIREARPTDRDPPTR